MGNTLYKTFLSLLVFFPVAQCTLTVDVPFIYGLEGKQISLKCDPESYGVQSKITDVTWQSPNPKSEFELNLQDTTQDYQIKKATSEDSGDYTCQFKNEKGEIKIETQILIVVKSKDTDGWDKVYKKIHLGKIPLKSCKNEENFLSKFDAISTNFKRLKSTCYKGNLYITIIPTLPSHIKLMCKNNPTCLIRKLEWKMLEMSQSFQYKFQELLKAVDDDLVVRASDLLLNENLNPLKHLSFVFNFKEKDCPQGFYEGPDGSHICIPCPPGYSSDALKFKCVLCSKNTFQDSFGKPCKKCIGNKDETRQSCKRTDITSQITGAVKKLVSKKPLKTQLIVHKKGQESEDSKTFGTGNKPHQISTQASNNSLRIKINQNNKPVAAKKGYLKVTINTPNTNKQKPKVSNLEREKEAKLMKFIQNKIKEEVNKKEVIKNKEMDNEVKLLVGAQNKIKQEVNKNEKVVEEAVKIAEAQAEMNYEMTKNEEEVKQALDIAKNNKDFAKEAVKEVKMEEEMVKEAVSESMKNNEFVKDTIKDTNTNEALLQKEVKDTKELVKAVDTKAQNEIKNSKKYINAIRNNMEKQLSSVKNQTESIIKSKMDSTKNKIAAINQKVHKTVKAITSTKDMINAILQKIDKKLDVVKNDNDKAIKAKFDEAHAEMQKLSTKEELLEVEQLEKANEQNIKKNKNGLDETEASIKSNGVKKVLEKEMGSLKQDMKLMSDEEHQDVDNIKSLEKTNEQNIVVNTEELKKVVAMMVENEVKLKQQLEEQIDDTRAEFEALDAMDDQEMATIEGLEKSNEKRIKGNSQEMNKLRLTEKTDEEKIEDLAKQEEALSRMIKDIKFQMAQQLGQKASGVLETAVNTEYTEVVDENPTDSPLTTDSENGAVKENVVTNDDNVDMKDIENKRLIDQLTDFDGLYATYNRQGSSQDKAQINPEQELTNNPNSVVLQQTYELSNNQQVVNENNKPNLEQWAQDAYKKAIRNKTQKPNELKSTRYMSPSIIGTSNELPASAQNVANTNNEYKYSIPSLKTFDKMLPSSIKSSKLHSPKQGMVDTSVQSPLPSVPDEVTKLRSPLNQGSVVMSPGDLNQLSKQAFESVSGKESNNKAPSSEVAAIQQFMQPGEKMYFKSPVMLSKINEHTSGRKDASVKNSEFSPRSIQWQSEPEQPSQEIQEENANSEINNAFDIQRNTDYSEIREDIEPRDTVKVMQAHPQLIQSQQEIDQSLQQNQQESMLPESENIITQKMQPQISNLNLETPNWKPDRTYMQGYGYRKNNGTLDHQPFENLHNIRAEVWSLLALLELVIIVAATIACCVKRCSCPGNRNEYNKYRTVEYDYETYPYAKPYSNNNNTIGDSFHSQFDQEYMETNYDDGSSYYDAFEQDIHLVTAKSTVEDMQKFAGMTEEEIAALPFPPNERPLEDYFE